jgi:16S rRNA (guanine527-N7)-methyltransferase
MKSYFEKYGITLTDKQQELFEKYYSLLIEYNKKFNLTAITEREEVINKHFVDSSLSCGKVCGQTLLDVGSGGGFPAIPLKIMNDNLSVTMLEATGKKCEFLKTVVKELGLTNVTVINGRAEDIAKDERYREKFDCVTARAVARLNTLLEYCMAFVKVGGIFVALKGDAEEELIEAENAIKVLGGRLKESFNYELEGAKRALITVEKIKSTDKKYPRGNGKERKNPL